MPNKNFVAIYSPTPGCGKTTVAKTLQRMGYLPVKFAEPLKSMLAVFLYEHGVHPDDIDRMIEGDLKEAPIVGLGSITPRRLMQTLGTEWGRHCIDTEVWVNLATRKTMGLLDAGHKVVIDDLRFFNEYVALQTAGATMIRVSRPGFNPDPFAHVSDGSLELDIHWDHNIINASDLASLRVKIMELFR